MIKQCNAENGRKATIMGEKKMEEAMNAIFDKLTNEQKEQAKTCKTTDGFMKLASEWGIELPDELADAVAGGEVKVHDVSRFPRIQTSDQIWKKRKRREYLHR